MHLESIKILWRQPDNGALWGIPYETRSGQQPYDLWRAHRDYVAPRPGWYGSKQISLEDWVYLGDYEWHPEKDWENIKAFLEMHKDLIPQGPNEWSSL